MKFLSLVLALTTSCAALAQTSMPQPPDDRSTLQAIFNNAAANLADIQRLLDTRNYQAALSKAKVSLDDVRMKSGIHPKASYREKIAVRQGALTASFNSIGMSKKDLDIDAQDAVTLAVANYRAGYFLDILNLMKRTNLLYLEALQGSLSDHGRLLAEDVAKIRNDIQDVQAIPLYMKDPSVGGYFLVFDYEVANNDQAYLFNRELKTYLLGQGRALGIKNEKQIDEMLQAHVNAVRADYVRSFSSGSGVVSTTVAPVAFRSSNGSHLTRDGRFGVRARACYYADSNGQTYGDAVSDYNCKEGFIVSNNACYYRDSAGMAYGDAVSDYNCQKK